MKTCTNRSKLNITHLNIHCILLLGFIFTANATAADIEIPVIHEVTTESAKTTTDMDTNTPSATENAETKTSTDEVIESNTETDSSHAGSVTRAMFTSKIINREPTDDIISIDVSNGEIIYFTELKNLTGSTIIHRWEYKGEIMAEVKFAVGSPRWRVYSSKSIIPRWAGLWTVTVIDESGRILKASSIDVTSNPDTEAPDMPMNPDTEAPDMPMNSDTEAPDMPMQ